MNLTEHFKLGIKNNRNFVEALKIVQNNIVGGNIWVIGGAVYRSIVKSLDNPVMEENFDFDFIVEKPVDTEKISLPSGWKLVETGLGEPRFVEGNKQIDFVFIDNSVNLPDKKGVNKMTTQEKIESYFRHVMLTVQAIVYDVDADRVYGELASLAIRKKLIETNNLDECISFCKRRKISVREFFRRKADSLNFKAIYPTFSGGIHEEETVRFYDRYTREYERVGGYRTFISDHLNREMRTFVSALPGKKVLDLGSGPGRDALFLKRKGLNPLCVDLSSEMVKQCKRKGLKARQMDIENLDFRNESFDGIWAYASLVHIPKQRIYNSIVRIRELLKPEGLLFLGMVEGRREKIYESKTKPGIKRFFSLYTNRELQDILREYFEIVAFKKFTTSNNQTYLNYICQKDE